MFVLVLAKEAEGVRDGSLGYVSAYGSGDTGRWLSLLEVLYSCRLEECSGVVGGR